MDSINITPMKRMSESKFELLVKGKLVESKFHTSTKNGDDLGKKHIFHVKSSFRWLYSPCRDMNTTTEGTIVHMRLPRPQFHSMLMYKNIKVQMMRVFSIEILYCTTIYRNVQRWTTDGATLLLWKGIFEEEPKLSLP